MIAYIGSLKSLLLVELFVYYRPICVHGNSRVLFKNRVRLTLQCQKTVLSPKTDNALFKNIATLNNAR